MTPELRKQAAELLTDLYYFASFAVDPNGAIRGSWGIVNNSGIVTLTDAEAMSHICKEHERLAKERNVRWELMKELMTAITMDEPKEELPERDIAYMRRLLDSKDKQIKAHHDLWRVKRARKKRCGSCPRKSSCEERLTDIEHAKAKYQAADLEHTKESEAAQLEYKKEMEEVEPAEKVERFISDEVEKLKPIISNDIRVLAADNKIKCHKCGYENNHVQLLQRTWWFGKFYFLYFRCTDCFTELGRTEVRLSLTPEGIITFSQIHRDNSWADKYYTEDSDDKEK